jgi:putative transposase
VDTTGLLVGVLVHPANVAERAGAKELLAQLKAQGSPGLLGRLEVVRADGGYGGKPFKEWVHSQCGWHVEVVEKPKGQKGFAVLSRRWVVERTFAWLGRSRRLSKDHEQSPSSSRAMILWAMSHLMLKRL